VTILRGINVQSATSCEVGREGRPESWIHRIPTNKRGQFQVDALFPEQFPGAPLQYVPGIYAFAWVDDEGPVRRVLSGGRWKAPEYDG
jgi:hypothetical protein